MKNLDLARIRRDALGRHDVPQKLDAGHAEAEALFFSMVSLPHAQLVIIS